jgi:NAD(P)-dependent dehydrogenase (short-subunit alcohol dehydrogenase family)
MHDRSTSRRSSRDSISTCHQLALAAVLGGAAWWGIKRFKRMRRKLDLPGRTVLIVGGSRGLGLALARQFGKAGCRVALVARKAEELAAAEADLRGGVSAMMTVPCDATDAQQMRDAVGRIEREFGAIDVLVNCAGTMVVGPWETMTVEDFRQVMDANFFSALHAIMAVVPAMRWRGGGRIINIGSVGGKVPVPHLAAYCASKFALVGLSDTLRAELTKDHIFVTTVNPGLMRTGSPRNAFFKGDHRAEYAWFAIGDSLPGISMSATRAARRIVEAAQYGDAEVALGWPAALAITLHGLMPAIHTELMALMNRLLPTAEHAGGEKQPGYASESRWTRSVLTSLSRKAEKQYHQRVAT